VVRRCRPTASLAFVGPVVIAALLIGLAVGASGVWLLLRAQYAARAGVGDKTSGPL
jgi:hypothetical protein